MNSVLSLLFTLCQFFLGADVHAKDKGGLVPLHNACSYGHYEVTELLVKHGASVNVCDLWRFTPLHEVSHRELEQIEARLNFQVPAEGLKLVILLNRWY